MNDQIQRVPGQAAKEIGGRETGQKVAPRFFPSALLQSVFFMSCMRQRHERANGGAGKRTGAIKLGKRSVAVVMRRKTPREKKRRKREEDVQSKSLAFHLLSSLALPWHLYRAENRTIAVASSPRLEITKLGSLISQARPDQSHTRAS